LAGGLSNTYSTCFNEAPAVSLGKRSTAIIWRQFLPMLLQ
jgi:hypothetical protein